MVFKLIGFKLTIVFYNHFCNVYLNYNIILVDSTMNLTTLDKKTPYEFQVTLKLTTIFNKGKIPD